jgi:hypothetical protein
MKNQILLFVLMMFAGYAYSQSGPVLVWEKGAHDFGEVAEGTQVSHTFRFTNKGNEPLILTRVQPSCGCTVPNNWPKDPIMPGGTGEISVSFNSTGRVGANTKVVQVFSNASNEGSKQFSFTAKVIAKQPAN